MDLRYRSYAILSRQQHVARHPAEERIEREIRDRYPDLKQASVAEAELLLVFGGDGTLLEAVRSRGSSSGHLLVFHAGTVGFLATTRDQQRFDDTLALALRGELESMSIPLMRIQHWRGNDVATSYAVNEVFIDCPMTWVTLQVEQTHAERHRLVKEVRGSGLYVCSAVGSTSPMGAHYQAPRMDPELRGFYLKGIHDTRRPTGGILLSGEKQSLRITLTNIEANTGIPEEHRRQPSLFADGLHRGTLAVGDEIDIAYLEQPSVLLRRADETHWDRVRDSFT